MRPKATGLFVAGGVLIAGVGLASCSANMSRFDYPMFASNEQDAPQTTASLKPVPAEPVHQAAPTDSTVVKTQLSPLPWEPTRMAAATPPPTPRPAPPMIQAPAVPKPATIQVRRGDTLSAVARRHNVSVQEIMAANNMRTTRLRLGQKLKIPGRNAAPRQFAATHRVKSGEYLSSIANRYGVDYKELARHNGLRTNAVLKPGQILKVPAGRPPAAAPVRVAARGATVPLPQAKPTRPAPRVASPKTRTAARPAAVLPQPQPMTGNRFRWPVRGRVISGFGAKPNGKHNDGINVAVPLGASVKAAENGVVAYAGSELEGYGNLILIRHANNWVSAYAHNDEVLVKRGDEVRRGQIIAKAGKTGTVSQPQVHFELRKGSQPVNPLKYLASS